MYSTSIFDDVLLNLKNYLPVTDGKNMPIRVVNDVVMSTNTILNVFDVGRMSIGLWVLAINCPASKKFPNKFSVKKKIILFIKIFYSLLLNGKCAHNYKLK